MAYEVGDRVVMSNDPNKLKSDFLNRTGTVAYVEASDGWCRVILDRKNNPNDEPDGWKIQNESMSLLDVPTAEEVDVLFGVKLPPSKDSTQIELLEHIDTALRNGTKPNRAILAFELLLASLGHSRLDLPSYVKDMQR